MIENPPRKLHPEDEFATGVPLEVPPLAANDNDEAETSSVLPIPEVEFANDNNVVELADSEKREAVLNRLHTIAINEDAKEDFRGHGEAINENAIESATESAERAVAKAEANVVVNIAASPTGGKEGPKLTLVKNDGESGGKRKLPRWLKLLGKGLKWLGLSIMGALALIPTGLRMATDKIMEQAGTKGSGGGGSPPKKASGGGGGHH